METLKQKILDVPDFPEKGIIFRDVTPLLSDPKSFKTAIDIFINRYCLKQIDAICAVESRGFFLAAPLAYQLGKGLHLIRKQGKLPRRVHTKQYALEYGSATLELHQDELKKGARVLLIDDLLATGGTAQAAAQLVEQAEGKVVEIAFLIELLYCKGRERLKNYPIFSIIEYE